MRCGKKQYTASGGRMCTDYGLQTTDCNKRTKEADVAEAAIRELQETAIALVHEAGAAILAVSEAGVRDIQFKGEGTRDLVTEADKRSEAIIVEAITRRYPDHRILAEEGTGTGGTGEYRWIIDPLDGTTNFAHKYPLWCVSIAVEHAGAIVAGVVFAPYIRELFVAARGDGATLNGRPIHVSPTLELPKALLCTGFPYRLDASANNLSHWSNFVLRSQGTRRDGAAALDLCYVAAGRYDGFWEFGLSPWDVAAGSLIVQEAGGTMSTPGNTPYTPETRDVVASNGHLHSAMLDVLAIGRNGHGTTGPVSGTPQTQDSSTPPTA